MHRYFKIPHDYSPIVDRPFSFPDLTIVIPAFKEKYITNTLASLALSIEAADLNVHIIIVVNQAVDASADISAVNKQCILDIQAFAHAKSNIDIDIIQALDMPVKKAGVGLARKIGLDEATFRYHKNDKNGIVACFDADSTCSINYVEAVVHYFEQHKKMDAVSIYFEHALSGQFKEQIIQYELHLRLYINFQKRIGLPFAIHTVGSSMAVRSASYIAKGGMNTRKAGEDFYFLHKFIEDQVCGELFACAIYPSSRVSDRVPFGTGRAILEMERDDQRVYKTYHPQSYLEYHKLLLQIDEISTKTSVLKIEYSVLHPVLREFLDSVRFEDILAEISNNTKSPDQFMKRFFKRCNAFFFMKYLHHMRDAVFPDIAVKAAADSYLASSASEALASTEEVLLKIRGLDRKRSVYHS